MEPQKRRLAGLGRRCIVGCIDYNADWHGHFGLRKLKPFSGWSAEARAGTPTPNSHDN